MTATRVGRPRRRIVLLVIVAAIIILAISLRSLAGLYTDSLWYSSIHQHEVFSTVLTTKIGLFLVFGLVFFLAMWGNLLLCNRLGPSELLLDAPEDELVRRFQSAVRPYAGRLYALLSFVLALIAASAAIGHWQDYLLFSNSKSFGTRDPLFNMDVSFYVFRLPFLTFVVDWVLASLVAIIVFTAVFHYLNGGIRAARVTPRVAPGVKVHLSVLLALLALAKAAGYLIARWHMVTSATNGIFDGAGYTDVHARLPALMLLFWLCIIAAGILLVNIWQRGWTLPVIAVGLWAFVALLIGVVYPAVLQAVKVTPAQSTLELPYIQRNIEATRMAYGLSSVAMTNFLPTVGKPILQQPGVSASLQDVRQWDPTASISQSTFQQLQGLRNYYSISAIGEDRYMVNGRLLPVVEGIRELNTAGVPSPTWVNQHLQFTHGYGIVLSASNQVQSPGQPVFSQANVPETRLPGWPKVTMPGIYFGLSQNGYVVVDSSQKEIDYENATRTVATQYHGAGGVPIGGFFRRLMFSIRFGDPNLILSSDITSTSKIIYMRNVLQIAQHAAPFLSIDAHPYAAIVQGHLDWVLDGYTTTDEYPYSQNASSQLVPADTGLPSSYNYVRNSVKIVVDAYTGTVSLYAMDPQDPILKAWESAFPGLIHPLSSIHGSPLLDHLRYPEDIFSIQAAIYGRYHLPTPEAFYSNGNGWSLSPTDGAGAPSNLNQVSTQVTRSGQFQSVARMDPLYQVYTLPGETAPSFTLTDAYVASQSNSQSSSSTSTVSSGVLNLSAFMVALSDVNAHDYGKLLVYRPPAGGTGPVQADSKMNANTAASSQISLLAREGSTVILGNVLMIPIDGSMLYVRPMYVSPTSSSYPQLKYDIVVYRKNTGFATTLGGALAQVLMPGRGAGGTHSTVNQLLALAQAQFEMATAALKAGGEDPLAAYEHHVNLGITYLKEANTRIAHQGSTSPGSTTTTTAPTTRRT
jgi:hypothetical protein